jgi:hypothetical protein
MNDSMRKLKQYERLVRGFSRRNILDATLDTLALLAELGIVVNLVWYLRLSSA